MKNEQNSFLRLPQQTIGIKRNVNNISSFNSKTTPQFLDASHGRLTCYLDGMPTSCHLVSTLLRFGFAVRVV